MNEQKLSVPPQLLSALKGLLPKLKVYFLLLFILQLQIIKIGNTSFLFVFSGSGISGRYCSPKPDRQPDGCRSISSSGVKATECFCSTDLCNGAEGQDLNFMILSLTFLLSPIFQIQWKIYHSPLMPFEINMFYQLYA